MPLPKVLSTPPACGDRGIVVEPVDKVPLPGAWDSTLPLPSVRSVPPVAEGLVIVDRGCAFGVPGAAESTLPLPNVLSTPPAGACARAGLENRQSVAHSKMVFFI